MYTHVFRVSCLCVSASVCIGVYHSPQIGLVAVLVTIPATAAAIKCTNGLISAATIAEVPDDVDDVVVGGGRDAALSVREGNDSARNDFVVA